MKPLLYLSGLLLTITLVPLASADAPKKVPLASYRPLWDNSPFTTKPEKIDVSPVNPFDDYVLSALSPLGSDWFVVLQNKKKPDDRVTIQPGVANALNAKVSEVRYGSPRRMSTTVMITDGRKSGLVGFDEKLLVIKPPAGPKNQGQPGQPGQPGFNPGQPPPLQVNPGQPVVLNNNPNPNPVSQGAPGGGRFGGNGGGGNGGAGTSGREGRDSRDGGGSGRSPRPRVVPPPTR